MCKPVPLRHTSVKRNAELGSKSLQPVIFVNAEIIFDDTNWISKADCMEMAGALYLAAEYPLLLSHRLQEVFKVQFHELSVLRLAKNTHQPCIQKTNPLHGRDIRVQHISAVYLCAPCVGDLFLQLQWSKKTIPSFFALCFRLRFIIFVALIIISN